MIFLQSDLFLHQRSTRIIFYNRKLISDPDLAFRGCSEGQTPPGHFVQICTTRRLTPARPFSRARPLQRLRSLPPPAGTSETHTSLEDPQKNSLVSSGLSPLGDLAEDHLTNTKTTSRR